MTTATLLDGADWAGNIFVGGSWRAGSAGDAPIIEPATGEELGRTGRAGVDDVATAAASAAEAQRAWAALPHTQRAAVLRKAGDLFTEHGDELGGWNVREVGAVPGMAGFALHVAAEECYAAAALTGAPLGELIPSEQPRLSMAKRVPAGVVGVISPFNVPLILSIRSVAPALALGNSVLLKPDPRTVMTGGVNIVRVLEEAGLPAGVLQLVPGGVDVGEALVSDPHVRVISFTGSTKAGRAVGELAGQSPQARAPRARRELRDAGARRRRCREGGQPRGLGLLLPPGPDLHDDRSAPRGRRDLRRLRRGAGRQGRAPAGGQPGHRRGRPRPGHRRGPARQDPRPGHRDDRCRGEGGRRCVVRRAVLPPDRARRGHPGAPRLHRGDLRPGRPGDAGRRPRTRRSSWPAPASTASPSASSPPT